MERHHSVHHDNRSRLVDSDAMPYRRVGGGSSVRQLGVATVGAPGSRVPGRRRRSVRIQPKPTFYIWPVLLQGYETFKLPAFSRSMVSLEVDDLWRIIEMTLLLGLIVPITGKCSMHTLRYPRQSAPPQPLLSFFLVQWFKTRWHAAIHMHRFVNLMYFTDIVHNSETETKVHNNLEHYLICRSC